MWRREMSAHFVSCFAFENEATESEQIISFNRCAVNRCGVEKTRGLAELPAPVYEHTHRGCSQELARLEEGRQRALLQLWGTGMWLK